VHPPDPPESDAAERIAADEARRLRWEAGIRPDPERVAAGWERRFLADPARAREATELYERMGFEVALDPVRPEDLEEGCADCALVTTAGFRMLYTRRR